MTADTTYKTHVRSFDHSSLVRLPSYHRLRESLSDIGNEIDRAGGMSLAEFLPAAQDMALTSPYADCCFRHDTPVTVWPYRIWRDGDWLRCAYRCPECGHDSTCGYSVDLPAWLR